MLLQIDHLERRKVAWGSQRWALISGRTSAVWRGWMGQAKLSCVGGFDVIGSCPDWSLALLPYVKVHKTTTGMQRPSPKPRPGQQCALSA